MTEQLQELMEVGRPREIACGMIEHYRDDIMRSLNYDQIANPRGGPLSIEAFTASVALEVSTNERVAKAMIANPASFVKSITLAAQCKLLVGSAYDLFYLIPRWNGRERREEVTPLIGYKGLCDLALRHPRVHKVEAHLVFEGEEFLYDAGAGKLTHIVNMMGERTEDKMVGGYARVVLTDPAGVTPVLDDPVIHVMNREQLLEIKHNSDAYRQAERPPRNGGEPRRNSAWHTNPLPMHRKSLIRAVLNGGSVPRDMGVGAAITADDQAQIPVDEPALPSSVARSRTDSIKQALKMEPADPAESVAPAEPFALAEEVVSVLEQVSSIEEAEAMRDRWQHFEGEDAALIANAWEQMEARLRGEA